MSGHLATIGSGFATARQDVAVDQETYAAPENLAPATLSGIPVTWLLPW